MPHRPAGTLKPILAATLLLAVGVLTQSSSAWGSGGSGGGGGVTGGGGGGTVQAPVISSFKSTAGYRPGGGASGAIWTSYSVKTSGVPQVRLTITDVTHGGVIFCVTYSMASLTIDDDFVAFDTTFLVQLDLLDASGAAIDSRSATVTTPSAKTQP